MVGLRELERPVGRVFRRLRFQRFLGATVWAWAGAFLAAAAAIAAFKVLNRPLPCPDWVPFAAAAGAGLLIAALVAILTGPSRLDAATALDRAFHLHERVSSALTLPDDFRDTPAGRALVADAIRRVEALDVASAFGFKLPRRAWVAAAPALLAFGLLFVPGWAPGSVRAASPSKAVDPKAVARQSETLAKKVAAKREAIDKEKFPEAENILAEIEKKSNELGKAPPAQKDKLLVEMNKLSDALKDRQKQLGTPEQIAKQLQQLKDMGEKGPMDQLAKDLARGDFAKAMEQVKELQEKLKSDKLTAAEKKALEKQLGEAAKKLSEVANMADRKKQLDEARKNGGLNQEQYEREVEKLKQQAKNLQQLQKLAEKLGQAQQAMQKGESKQAAEAMGEARQQLADMAKNAEEMQALDDALAEVMDAKNGMAEGLNQLGEGLPGMNDMFSNRRSNNNNGSGRGRGAGDRAEAADDTATFKTKTDQQIQKGKAVFQGFGEPGKAVKGEARINIQAELEAASGGAADALSNQRIPKSLEKHVRSYYDQLNKGR
ncbi:hypothetical protein [Paludisphaera mucosa]|uniref:Chromosome partition protein Smc n=1 Tax=Paludisphaera mucosa TaxID=3030827 RepID=A0ABT6FAA8_9BACT|nr:hypothetical protein [Paludisphaera mucosa]MDG3004490.1 hypothetical protein [Paludisphaera mucosa]